MVLFPDASNIVETVNNMFGVKLINTYKTRYLLYSYLFEVTMLVTSDRVGVQTQVALQN